MGRAPCCDKANVKRGPWSPEEDAKLKAYIEEHGTGSNWIALPQKIGLKRCGKSCRLRWLNYLRPDIRHGGFSEEEDQIICSLYISIGSRWSIIAAQLPGRTDNDIKNYWNTRLKKKLLGRRREMSQSRRSLSLDQESSSPNGSDHDSPNSQTLSAMALERMQLHLQLQGLQHPFSLYNNPALWPAFNPLGPTRLFQEQQVGATIAVDRMNQGHDNASLEASYQQSLVPLVSDTPIYPTMGANIQEELFQSSNFNDVGGGLQAEQLQGLLSAQECHMNQLTELDCFQEMDAAKENVNWWTTNCFDAKSSSSSWDSASSLQPDSVLQEYVLGYDL